MSSTLAGVIGWPVAHSRSPVLHRHWLRRYGIEGDYVRFPVPPDRLEQALRALPALGIVGVNVTVPHKEGTARLVDRLRPAAASTGSVNVVTVLSDGTLEGDSTDGYGFMESLRQAVPGRTRNTGPVLLIGAGGAARAIAQALIDDGETLVTVANRTAERASALAEDLGAFIRPGAWEDRNAALASAVLVVNATTLGMRGQPPLELDLGLLRPEAVVVDIVYAPLQTPLLAGARARGNPVVDGLGMLLHQARPAFARWFGREPEVDADLRSAVLATFTA